MLATNKRIVRYRLLGYPDMVMQDQVEGLMGRPMGGVLGAMFNVVAKGRVVWSRRPLVPLVIDGQNSLTAHYRQQEADSPLVFDEE